MRFRSLPIPLLLAAACIALLTALGCSGAPTPPAREATLAAAPQALATGTVTQPVMGACPAGLAPGGQCATVSLTCGVAPALGATLAIYNPSGVVGMSGRGPLGTIVMFAGGAGTKALGDQQVEVAAFTSYGFKVVQWIWATAWEDIPAKSVRTAACRPALALQWVRGTMHTSSTLSSTRGFCAQGHSAGGAAIAYTLAAYSGDAYLDYVQLTSSPPLAAMDQGCVLPANATGCCNATYSLAYEPFALAFVNTWEGITTCGGAPTQTELSKLAADSILATGSRLFYQYTPVALVTCAEQSAAAGMSVLYESALQGAGTNTHRICVGGPQSSPPGQCSFESVLTDPIGLQATLEDMKANCVSTR